MLGDIKVLTDNDIRGGGLYADAAHRRSAAAHPRLGRGLVLRGAVVQQRLHRWPPCSIGSVTMTGWTVNEGTSSISPTGAGGTTKTTIAPVIDHVVHSGEWFVVSRFLDQIVGGVQTDTAVLPGVTDLALVDWVGRLRTLPPIPRDRLDGQGRSDHLRPFAAGDRYAQQLDEHQRQQQRCQRARLGPAEPQVADHVRKAGEQLAPETNYGYAAGRHHPRVPDRPVSTSTSVCSAWGRRRPALASIHRLASVPATASRRPPVSACRDRRTAAWALARDEDTAYFDAPSFNPNFANSGLWGQAFGAGLQQDPRAHVDGYGTHIYGALVGMDNWVNPNFRIGFAGGWGHTGIDGEGNTVANETSVSSYMGIAYGALKGYGLVPLRPHRLRLAQLRYLARAQRGRVARCCQRELRRSPVPRRP